METLKQWFIRQGTEDLWNENVEKVEEVFVMLATEELWDDITEICSDFKLPKRKIACLKEYLIKRVKYEQSNNNQNTQKIIAEQEKNHDHEKQANSNKCMNNMSKSRKRRERRKKHKLLNSNIFNQEKSKGKTIETNFNVAQFTSTCTTLQILDSLIITFSAAHNLLSNNSDQKNYGNTLINCLQLKKLKQIMTTNNFKSDEHNICDLLNSYLYLLKHHNDIYAFEFIFKELGGFCDVTNCSLFERNYRNRHNENELHLLYSDTKTAYRQIIDKIHCFYMHSFDVGCKLNSKQRLSLSITTSEEKKNDQHLDFRNETVSKINTILSNRHNIFFNRLTQKYNQLFSVNQQDIDFPETNNKIYSFGVQFQYDANHKQITTCKAVIVHAKYCSLKEELTTNVIKSLSSTQFNNEYYKAKTHLNADHRKQNYALMLLNHLVCLMIYCNYTQLQSEFSKTYYLNANVKKHHEFY
eukprot:300894_1